MLKPLSLFAACLPMSLALAQQGEAPKAPLELRPGDQVKITVRLEDAKEIQGLRFIELGGNRAELKPVSSQLLEGKLTISQYLREPKDDANQIDLELGDRAHNHAYVFDGKDPRVTAYNISGLVAPIKPEISSIVVSKASDTKIIAEFDVNAPVGFGAYVYAKVKYDDGIDGPHRNYRADAKCEGSMPSHCRAKVKVPADIPGTFEIVVGTLSGDSSDTRDYKYSGQDFPSLDWPRAALIPQNSTQIKLSDAELVSQDGRRIEVSFKAEGGLPGKSLVFINDYDTYNARGDKVTSDKTQTTVPAKVKCDDGRCVARFSLPKVLSSRSVGQIYLTTSNGSNSAKIDPSVIDWNVMEQDDQAPRIVSVTLEKLAPPNDDDGMLDKMGGAVKSTGSKAAESIGSSIGGFFRKLF